MKRTFIATAIIAAGSSAQAGTIAELTEYDAFMYVDLSSASQVSYVFDAASFTQFDTFNWVGFATTTAPVVSQTADTSDPQGFSLMLEDTAQGKASALVSADDAEMIHAASSGTLTITNAATTAQTIGFELYASLEVFWYDNNLGLTPVPSPAWFNFGQAFAEAYILVDGVTILDNEARAAVDTYYVRDTFPVTGLSASYTIAPQSSVDVTVELFSILQAGYIEDVPGATVPLPGSLVAMLGGIGLIGALRLRSS